MDQGLGVATFREFLGGVVGQLSQHVAEIQVFGGTASLALPGEGLRPETLAERCLPLLQAVFRAGSKAVEVLAALPKPTTQSKAPTTLNNLPPQP